MRRRRFLQAGTVAAAGIATGTLPAAAVTTSDERIESFEAVPARPGSFG